MAENIDLMAFAKGAELANKANWQDTLNDITARTAEARLMQSQAAFGIGMPLMEEQKASQLQQLQGNRAAGETIAGILGEAGRLQTPEEQNALILRRMQEQFSTIGQNPGDQFRQQALQRYALDRAGMAVKGGDANLAAQFAAMVPGNPFTKQVTDLAAVNDPRIATDAIRLQQLGAEAVDTARGVVTYGGQQYPINTFLGMQRDRIQQGLNFNPYTVANQMAQINQRNQVLTGANPAWAGRGIQYVQNPYGNPFAIPLSEAAPTVATGGMAMPAGPIPGGMPVPQGGVIPGLEQYVLPQGTPLPSATAAAYPETAGMRYPAPTQATPLWQDWLQQAMRQKALMDAQRATIAAPYLPAPTPQAPGYTPGVAPAYNNWITGGAR